MVFIEKDPISINVLYNYFAGDPEQAYAAMKPMLDLLKEQEKKRTEKLRHLRY